MQETLGRCTSTSPNYQMSERVKSGDRGGHGIGPPRQICFSRQCKVVLLDERAAKRQICRNFGKLWSYVVAYKLCPMSRFTV